MYFGSDSLQVKFRESDTWDKLFGEINMHGSTSLWSKLIHFPIFRFCNRCLKLYHVKLNYVEAFRENDRLFLKNLYTRFKVNVVIEHSFKITFFFQNIFSFFLPDSDQVTEKSRVYELHYKIGMKKDRHCCEKTCREERVRQGV